MPLKCTARQRNAVNLPPQTRMQTRNGGTASTGYSLLLRKLAPAIHRCFAGWHRLFVGASQ
ncbi:hypothetical protein HAX54_015332, partial [Datura stramonium]|nr:hypothetical protein [Datura stramonium]